MTQIGDDRFTKIAYLHLFEGSSEPTVFAILKERGATETEAAHAIRLALAHLEELRTYRNRELFKTVIGGIAVILLGWFVSDFASDAPGRFRGMPFTIMLLGGGIVIYGLWARAQPR